MNSWFVYIILASDGRYYTGISTDPERRFREHCSGARGARFFAGRQPERLVYLEGGHNRSSATKREYAIKQLSRGHKEQLIAAAQAGQQ